jgi:hypothetical protein
MTTIPPFARRRNKDSSIDSICTSCFQTIASLPCEDDLAAQEQKHSCDPLGEFVNWRAYYPNRTDGVRRRPASPQTIDGPGEGAIGTGS